VTARSRSVEQPVLLRSDDGNEVAVLVNRPEAAVVQQVEDYWHQLR
jgi:hypothetical protein